MPARKPSEKSPFVSRVHAAAMFDCSVQLIDKFIKCGKLKAYRLGRKVLVRREELLRLLEEVPQ
jgi:excisionase family DNA binding protein